MLNVLKLRKTLLNKESYLYYVDIVLIYRVKRGQKHFQYDRMTQQKMHFFISRKSMICILLIETNFLLTPLTIVILRYPLSDKIHVTGKKRLISVAPSMFLICFKMKEGVKDLMQQHKSYPLSVINLLHYPFLLQFYHTVLGK